MFESPTVWAWLWMWYGTSPSQEPKHFLQQHTKYTGQLEQTPAQSLLIAGMKKNF